MDTEAYETIIQASAKELEGHLSKLFRDDGPFEIEFQPMTSWDDTWKLIHYFEGEVAWWEGQRFHIYLSILLRQKVAGVFRLSSIDKPTVCKAAILTRHDPLDFHADLEAVTEENKQTSGLFAFVLAIGNGMINDENGPIYRRVTNKIVQLQLEDLEWRMDNDIPL